jgi:ribosomal protein L7/L12
MDAGRILDIRNRLQTKGLMDQLMVFELGIALAQVAPVPLPPVTGKDGNGMFDNEQLRLVVKVLAYNPIMQGKKIQIIKILRDLTGLGLPCIKDLVDEVYRNIPASVHLEPSSTNLAR